MTAQPWYEESEAEPDPGVIIRKPFERFDLGKVMRDGGPEPPKLIAQEMLYPECVHSLSGPGEVGKTTLAFWFAKKVLEDGGTVGIVDEEGGPNLTAARLLALGVTDLMAARVHYFPFPGRSWSDPDIAEWHDLCNDLRPTLWIFDSSAACMAIAGLDENSPKDAIRFYHGVLLPAARKYSAAVVVIDHDAKYDGANGQAASRYSRGTGAKFGAIDVQFKVSSTQPFSRMQSGVIRLEVTKDRPGWMHPRLYHIEVSSGLDIWFRSDSETLAAEARDKLDKLTPAESKVLACCTDKPAGIARLTQRVAAAYSMNFKRETMSRALSKLSDLGLVVKVADGGSGRGDEALWIRAQDAKHLSQPVQPMDEQLPMDRA